MFAHVRGEQRPALDFISQEPFLSSERKSLIDLELTVQTRWTGKEALSVAPISSLLGFQNVPLFVVLWVLKIKDRYPCLHNSLPTKFPPYSMNMNYSLLNKLGKFGNEKF